MSNPSITAWSINRVGDEKKQEFIQQVANWLGDKEKAQQTFEVRFDKDQRTATIFWYALDEQGEKIYRPDGMGVEYEYEVVKIGDFDHSYYDGAYVSAEMWDGADE